MNFHFWPDDHENRELMGLDGQHELSHIMLVTEAPSEELAMMWVVAETEIKQLIEHGLVPGSSIESGGKRGMYKTLLAVRQQ